MILKIAFTLFVIILVPIYWSNYGIQNFLWFSDIGLLVTLAALWLESRLLISVLAVGMLPVELVWNIAFFVRLLTGYPVLGLVAYMFNAQYSLFLRGLSLFHVILPGLWLWHLIAWGYDERALKYFVVIFWIVLLATYFFTDPEKNINWVFAPEAYQWRMPGWLWLCIIMICYPVICVLPMHILLKNLFTL